MHRKFPLERETRGGSSEGVDFVIEASLFDIGFALVTEVAIDGQTLISFPAQVKRAHTLEQALDQGKAFAVCEIARLRGAPAQ
ncbi:hypothetical protein AO715_11410 [Xanthomonas sp. Mitacek01]|nr:hypothetical protein AO715_11410 [Xanthomonas sp. Mitacek01]